MKKIRNAKCSSAALTSMSCSSILLRIASHCSGLVGINWFWEWPERELPGELGEPKLDTLVPNLIHCPAAQGKRYLPD
jgi:hypothetical protein